MKTREVIKLESHCHFALDEDEKRQETKRKIGDLRGLLSKNHL